jgi:peptidoglycan/LPS O-acetylase OafA/YrhL
MEIPLISGGGLAVDLFVILSGFVITLLLIKRPEPYHLYIFRRWVRLYPLYIIALALGYVTQHLYAPVIGASLFGAPEAAGFSQRLANIQENLGIHMALHATLLHGVVPDKVLNMAALAFSGPLWSISLEWQFYLLAPLLVWCFDLRQPGRRLYAAGALIVIAVFYVLAKKLWHGEVQAFLPLKMPLFLLGIMSGFFWEKAQKASPLHLTVALAICFVAVLSGRSTPIPVFGWALTYWAASLAARSRFASPVSSFFMLKPLRWLGERSYGVYVLHMPIVLMVCNWVIIPARLGQLGTLVAIFACFPFVLMIAALMYRWIERPLVNWAKGVGRTRREEDVTPVPSLAS